MELIVMGASIVGNVGTIYLKHFGCDACGAKCFRWPLEIFNSGKGCNGGEKGHARG